MKHQKQNWFLDLVLLLGFLVCFFIDATGIDLHQWLGLGISVLAFAHLCLHWDWVKAVFSRFFGKTSTRSRVYGLIDLSLFMSMFLILETGLLTSTWLNLDLAGFSSLLEVHLWSSIASLFILIAKLSLHWRWIVTVAHKIFPPAVQAFPQTSRLAPARVQQQFVNRRRFLWMAGLVAGASALAVSRVLAGAQTAALLSEETGEAAPESQTATEMVTKTDVVAEQSGQITPTMQTAELSTAVTSVATAGAPDSIPVDSSCSIRCRKGCSYPGHCRRYTDSNANGRCDLGECI